jgi:L-asparaginase
VAARVLLVTTNDLHTYGSVDGRPATLSGTELLTRLPAPQQAGVTVEEVMTGPSWDMPPSGMLTLARRVRDAIIEERYTGVVVAQGIDTMEETAYLTDLLAGEAASRAAVVFTGAVRRVDDADADGPRNLGAAITAAREPTVRGAGAVLCLDNHLHAARWATNLGTTFSSDPYQPLAAVAGDRVVLVGPAPRRPPEPVGQPASDVALIRTYPGMTDAPLHAAVDNGAAGIVLEGVGPGNVPAELFATITELADWGVPVVVASRHPETQLFAADLPHCAGLALTLGAISAHGLNATKARIALMVALGTGNARRAQEWFDQL